MEAPGSATPSGAERARATVTASGRQRWLLAALVFGLFPIGVLVILASFQRNLMYFPDTSRPPSAAQVFPGGRDVTLRTADGLELIAWFAPASTDSAELDPASPGVDPTATQELTLHSTSSGYAVLLAPGNGGNRAGRADLARELTARGIAVLLMDYRGYGGNPGNPTEEGLAADADAAVAALVELGYPLTRIIYLGESLGTGVVTALATRHTPSGLVLRSPYTAFADVAAVHYPWLPVRRLLVDRYPLLEPLGAVQVPVSVIHGDRDDIVPSAQSHQVASAAPMLFEELVLEGVGHNDAEMFGSPVADAVQRLLEHLEESG